MHTENSIEIAAPATKVFKLAAEVERWPELLPHYRWVHVLRESDDERLVEMAARRNRVPVRWWAIETTQPESGRIHFRHVRGVTTGMDVVWQLESNPGGVRVRILHDFAPGWPLLGRLMADRVIGQFFVSNIASKTLKRIKAIAEAEDWSVTS